MSGSTGASASNSDFPTAVSAALIATLAAWAQAAAPLVPSAVAPGAILTPAPAADPTDVTNTLLWTLPAIIQLGGGPTPAPAMAAALQAAIVAAAIQAASTINYASRQDAQAMGAKLYAAIDQAIAATAVLAASDPLAITPVWRDLLGLKAALAADLNALIGRLPAVVAVNTTRTMPVWLLAHYAYGDTPNKIFAMWQDIIARNAIRNPAVMQAGGIELLNQ